MKAEILFLILILISCRGLAEIREKSYGLQAGIVRHSLTLDGANFNGTSSTANNGFGARVYGHGKFLDQFGVEVGMMVQERNYGITSAGLTQTASYTVMLWDLLARAHFSVFSVGVGGYLSIAVSSVTVSQNGATQTASLSDSGLNSTDTGALGSLRATFPVSGSISITAETRYLLGLKDLALRSEANAATRELQILAGGQLQF
jgi:hypothetical protein